MERKCSSIRPVRASAPSRSDELIRPGTACLLQTRRETRAESQPGRMASRLASSRRETFVAPEIITTDLFHRCVGGIEGPYNRSSLRPGAQVADQEHARDVCFPPLLHIGVVAVEFNPDRL